MGSQSVRRSAGSSGSKFGQSQGEVVRWQWAVGQLGRDSGQSVSEVGGREASGATGLCNS